LGRVRGTVDEGSCRTALDEIFEAEAGKEEDDPTTDGNNSPGSAVSTPVSSTTTTKQSERPEGEGRVDRGAEGGTADATTRGRVAPPMLRLDALDSALDAEGWASARLSSSAAVVASSAASTRTASEHLVRVSAPIHPLPRVHVFCLSWFACSRNLLMFSYRTLVRDFSPQDRMNVVCLVKMWWPRCTPKATKQHLCRASEETPRGEHPVKDRSRVWRNLEIGRMF